MSGGKRRRHRENVERREAKQVRQLIEQGEGDSGARWVHISEYAKVYPITEEDEQRQKTSRDTPR